MSKSEVEDKVQEEENAAPKKTKGKSVMEKLTKRKPRKSKKEKALEEQIKELEIQVAESKDKHLRLFAEFDNFKKRTIKEKLEFMRTASQDTLRSLLPVLDDFDRYKKSAEDEKSVEHFSDGVMLVYNKLYSTLKNTGLEPMESTGEDFDPEKHEAITEIPAPTEEMKGKVIDTVERGYLLKDKIIRYAKVVVGK